ncbi:MAG TPA: hypothetical protein VN982_15325 [Candidatus Dormibacteraeota bacterium]|nr:hypothetical protein [Candidatus Dormibacteraeota bacterium]
MLRQLQIHRQIIQDISVSMLAPLPSLYQRLLRLASLRDDLTGRYVDARFAELYPEAAVHESLAGCHEEILERILEIPLELQEKDLQQCLESMPGSFVQELQNWRSAEFENRLLPPAAPEYLKQLFRSNLRVLLQLLRDDYPAVR